jgi:hypothetical protein
MKLNRIVCDLKYAIKLKELGVSQTTSYAVYYGHRKNYSLLPFEYANRDMCGMLTKRSLEEVQSLFISTFTSDELLKMLPKEIKHNFNDHSSYCLNIGYDGKFNLPIVWYDDNDLDDKDEILISIGDRKMTNALAKMLIWVLEKSNSPLENPVKKIKTIKKPIPLERVIHTKVPKVFYSFKLNCWVYVSNPFTIKGNDMYWREFLNYETREKIDDCAEISLPRLSERTLKNINNQNLF